MSEKQPVSKPQGQVVSIGEPGVELLKFAVATLLGLQEFLSKQLPPAVKDFKIQASDAVPTWDLADKSVLLASRVAQRAQDSIVIARKVGANAGDIVGATVPAALKSIEVSLVSLSAALDRSPQAQAQVLASPPATAGSTSPAVSAQAQPSAGVGAGAQPQAHPMSKGLRIAIAVGCGVAVVGTIAVGMWVVSRGSRKKSVREFEE